MFSENNLGKDDSSISEDELLLHVCNNEKDVDEYLRSIAEYSIQYIIREHIMTRPSFVNISRIKKFKDLCDEDIVGRHFFIIDIIKESISILQAQLVANDMQISLNFKTYGLPIFIILSLLGNCLSAIVLFRKKMRSFSSNIYLGVLAICDIIYSMLQILGFVLIYIQNDWLLFFWNFLRVIFQFLSVWLIVAFTIERYIVTKYPLLRRSWCTVKRAKIVVITLMGLAIVYSFAQHFIRFLFIESKLINKNKNINIVEVFKQIEFYRPMITIIKTMYIIETITEFTLPALVIVICNTLIIYHIYQQNRVRKTLIIASDSSNRRAQISSDKMLQHKITKRLLLVSSIFVILKAPQHFFIYFSNYINYYVNTSVMNAIFYILDTAHYSINFILYCAMGQTFRRELICMFTKRTNIRRNRNIIEMDNYK